MFQSFCLCFKKETEKQDEKFIEEQTPFGAHPSGSEGWPGRVEPRRVVRPKFCAFFPSPATIFILFLSLGVFSCLLSSLSGSYRGILVVFEAPGNSNVHDWALWLSRETPAASKPPGLHPTAQEPKRAHFRVPAFKVSSGELAAPIPPLPRGDA